MIGFAQNFNLKTRLLLKTCFKNLSLKPIYIGLVNWTWICIYLVKIPPSTGTEHPVIIFEADDDKKMTMSAASEGWTGRLMICLSNTFCVS